MSKEERYDVVIIGAGHNGTTTAAYLAKCGLSVCVLEERPECGGAQETVEPMAGVRIQPHAIGNYGGSAPGWEQLELWTLRLPDGSRPQISRPVRSRPGSDGPSMGSCRSPTGHDGLGQDHRDAQRSALPQGPAAGHVLDPAPSELHRADANNIPYMQVYKQIAAGAVDRRDARMDLLRPHGPVHRERAVQGPRRRTSPSLRRLRAFPGRGDPGARAVATVLPPAVAKPVAARREHARVLPRAHFAAPSPTARSSAPAARWRRSSSRTGARRASACATTPPGARRRSGPTRRSSAPSHIKPTFLKLIGPRHLDAGFVQRIKDLSLKGGSLYMAHFLTRRSPLPPASSSGATQEPHAVHRRVLLHGSQEIYFKNLE